MSFEEPNKSFNQGTTSPEEKSGYKSKIKTLSEQLHTEIKEDYLYQTKHVRGEFSPFFIRDPFGDRRRYGSDGYMIGKNFVHPVDHDGHEFYGVMTGSHGYTELPKDLFLSDNEIHEEDIEELVPPPDTDKKRYGPLELYRDVPILMEAKTDPRIFLRKILTGDRDTITDILVSLNRTGREIIGKVSESKYDAVFFPTRSGVSHAWILKGYLQAMEGYLSSCDVELHDLPQLMAFWQKVRFKEHQPQVLDETVKKLESLVANSHGKKIIQVGYYDESFDTGSTTRQMGNYLEDAAKIVMEKSGDSEIPRFVFKDMTSFRGGNAGAKASIRTWESDTYDEDKDFEKIVRPSIEKNRAKHALHRILIELLKQAGRDIAKLDVVSYHYAPNEIDSLIKNYGANLLEG